MPQPSWAEVRRQFDLDPRWNHLGASQFIASHPRIVRDAIEGYRRELDRNPVLALERHNEGRQAAARRAYAQAMGAREGEVALTGNTTLGAALVYAGLRLRRGDEVVTTDHEHYSHWEAMRSATRRAGASLHRLRLYDGLAADVSADELVRNVLDGLGRRSRVLALTWVHSDSGLKLPVEAIAREAGGLRDPPLLTLDATHGFGVELERIAGLGFDFVLGDSHKWLYGPRGTGFIWGHPRAWERLEGTVASFTDLMDAYAEDEWPPGPMTGARFSPGGFHAFEHRWAVPAAFAFAAWVGGIERIRDRVHALAARLKQGLLDVDGVQLHTPLSPDLSSGIAAFEVAGWTTREARDALRRKRIVATVAPYPSALLRFTPGLYCSEEDVDAGIEAVGRLARSGRRRRPRPARRTRGVRHAVGA